MTKFKKGDIVRRRRGWSPMVVLKTPPSSNAQVHVAYASSFEDPASVFVNGREVHTGADFHPRRDLVLITSEKEIEKCRNWRERLTEKQHQTLLRQIETKTNQEENTMAKLYETKEETPRFGTYLATNSAGKIVLEMKGTGIVETFEKAEIEEVKPYTVRVRYNACGGSRDNGYEFFAKKGEVEKGDLLFLADYQEFGIVVAVDTKSNRATKNLHGRKLLSEPFGNADD